MAKVIASALAVGLVWASASFSFRAVSCSAVDEMMAQQGREMGFDIPPSELKKQYETEWAFPVLPGLHVASVTLIAPGCAYDRLYVFASYGEGTRILWGDGG